MTPDERFQMLRMKNLCLFPGAEITTGKHREGCCQRDFVCPHEIHDRYPVKKHILVCEEHKINPQNDELLQQFKARCMRSPTLPKHSRNIKLVFNSNSTHYHVKSGDEDLAGIYQLQQVTVSN